MTQPEQKKERAPRRPLVSNVQRLVREDGLVLHLPAAAGAGGGSWREAARCAEIDTELWFPEKGGSARQAKAVCRTCPVQRECLDYALANDERFGIWGGTTERDRRHLTRAEPRKDDHL